MLIGTQCRSSVTGDSDEPNRHCKVLPISEKVNVHDIRKERKLCAEFGSIYSTNKPTHGVVAKEKEIHANFAVAPQTVKAIATVCDT